MTRTDLIELLRRYAVDHPEEGATTGRVLALVEGEPRCFERDCFRPGHVTASAWIVSRESRAVLLTHHRKLDRWLQLGGHADGDPDVLRVALREAREESGLEDVRPVGEVIFDVDIHVIPARGDEAAHEHHDVRFLLEADRRAPLRITPESKALAWVPLDRVAELTEEESMLRMVRKLAGGAARTLS